LNALKDLPDTEISELDESLQHKMNDLDTLVHSVVTQVTSDLDAVTQKVQEIINSLPFRDHEPQLTGALPNFVVLSRVVYPTQIEFSGNFEFAAQSDFTPILGVIRGGVVTSSYAPDGVTTQQLKFLVPF
jgi:hypothetical protein